MEFLAVLQRPQAEQPRQRGRLQRLARQQVRTQRQAQQQARRQARRWKDRQLPTPQKGEEHTRVRPRPRAQRRSWRVKHPLRALMAEPVLHHQKNEHRVRNKSRSRQRQVVPAKPTRDRKLSKLQLKERPRARKQRDQLGSGHEVAKPRLLQNDHKNNESEIRSDQKKGRIKNGSPSGCGRQIEGKIMNLSVEAKVAIALATSLVVLIVGAMAQG